MEDKVIGKGTIIVEKCKVINGVEQPPYEVVKGENLWLTTGWTELLKVITGASASHWGAANTLIGVGDSTTAPAASQTDLIATTNVKYKGMESGFPTTPASGTVSFKAKFLTSEANFAWNEAVVKNNLSSVCWNRSTNGGSYWGTKTSTEVWYLTFTMGKA
jgi:hypothetical protein